jgi:hypothetical protein
VIINNGVGNLTLKQDNGGSLPGNHFFLPNLVDVVIPPGGAVEILKVLAGAGVTDFWMMTAKTF